MLMRTMPSVTPESSGQEIAAAVLEDLRGPDRWVQNAGMQGERRCMLMSAYIQMGWSEGVDVTESMRAGALRFAAALGFPSAYSVITFNDSPSTTHAQVIERLRLAL